MNIPASTLLSLVQSRVLDGNKLLEVFQGIHQAYQSGETERLKRNAERDEAIELLRSQRDVLLKAIDRVFDERASIVRNQFHALDHALTQKDPEVIKMALDGMVTVIQASPFRSIQEAQQALGDKNHTINLE